MKNIAIFSTRDIEIIELIWQEKDNKQIANKLGLSMRTIEWYKNKLVQLTGSKNIIGVIKYALKHNIVS